MRLGGGGINAFRGIVCRGVSRTSGTLPPIQGRTGGDCRVELGRRWRCDVKHLFAVITVDLGARGMLVEHKRERGD